MELCGTYSHPNGHVNCVRFSRDGTVMATACDDKVIRIWSTETLCLIRYLVGHQGEVRALDFSSDSSLIASCAWDRSVRVWEPEHSDESGVCECVSKSRHRIGTLSSDIKFAHDFPSDSDPLFASTADNRIYIWRASINPYTSDSSAIVGGGSGEQNGFHGRGRRRRRSVHMWHTKTVTGHRDLVSCIAFGRYDHSCRKLTLVSGSYDSHVRVWEIILDIDLDHVISVEALRTFKGHTSHVYCLDVCSQRNLIASGGEDKKVYIWKNISPPHSQQQQQDNDRKLNRKMTGRMQQQSRSTAGVVVKQAQRTLQQEIRPSTLSFVPGGNAIVVGGVGNIISIWSLSEGRVVMNTNLPKDVFQISSIALTEDGEYMGAADWGRANDLFGHLRLWQTSAVAVMRVVSMAFSNPHIVSLIMQYGSYYYYYSLLSPSSSDHLTTGSGEVREGEILRRNKNKTSPSSLSIPSRKRPRILMQTPDHLN
mmetsp:Transcript_25660/g.41478  ORF Transcript_25660/g.41478 Transcript_25660/m.41478 type:complete len:480 (-) Transcript_25660:114-1553(-)